MSTPFPPQQQPPFGQQPVGGYSQHPGYTQGAGQGYGAGQAYGQGQGYGPGRGYGVAGPYGGTPMAPMPPKSNGGLIAAIIAGVFVITLIGSIVVAMLYSSATSDASSDRTSSPTSSHSPHPTNGPNPSYSPSSSSTVTDEEEEGVVTECLAALSQAVSSPQITDGTIAKTGTNSQGEQQFQVEGTLKGTMRATGKYGSFSFTCDAVFHDKNHLYEAWATVHG